MPSGLDLLMARKAPKAEAIHTKEQMSESMPWVDKYRPKNLDEVSSPKTTVQILKKNLETANLPHMLFYGPPGTGKTSTILAMAKHLYGPRLFKTRVLELNASDERGISIVRERIKGFARLTVSRPSQEDKANYPCPPYKMIILDEADSMPGDAQSALRRTMETYSGITRFCLICNYVTRIIDPLASRCSKFRFKSLDEGSALTRLEYICGKESIDVDTNILKEILRISEGDLRRAINYLQSVSRLLSTDSDEHSAKDADNDVEMLDAGPDSRQSKREQVREMFGSMPLGTLSEFVGLLEKKNLNKIFEFIFDKISKEGYNGSILIESLHDKLLLGSTSDEETDLSLRLSNNQKNAISKVLFDTDCRLTEGCDEGIQILNCAVKISRIL